MGRARTMQVQQGLDDQFLLDTLTRDIAPTEAIFDLIDNSIDAARTSMSPRAKKDIHGLPASYADFKVAVHISESFIGVSDNCDGFHRDVLRNEAFILGKRSIHAQGVGYFGLGMKRALLALGDTYALSTNRPDFSARLRFNDKDLSLRTKRLTAELREPTKATRTTFAISDLKVSAAHEFAGDLTDLRIELSRRYGIFIKKGLQITLNGCKINPFSPSVRARGPVKPKRWQGQINGVDVFIESGMHAKYRHTNESDYSKATNSNLTDQYGWYVVCNDRIVEVAQKDKKFGFSTFWHPEYNGFLGWVHFVSDDPSKLPWDTKKTGVDPHLPLFASIEDTLEEYSDDFRTTNRTTRRAKKAKGKKGQKAKAKPKTPTGKGFHINQVDELLPMMAMTWVERKISSLLKEASELSLEFSFAGAALLRMIVERLVDQHIRRSGKLQAVKSEIFDAQDQKGRAFTDEQKANFEPTLGNLLDWLKRHREYFPDEVRSDCHQAVSKFSLALSKTINGAMHKATLVGKDQLATIRNEVYPLMDFLTSTPPKR